jgi:hypothetical protein
MRGLYLVATRLPRGLWLLTLICAVPAFGFLIGGAFRGPIDSSVLILTVSLYGTAFFGFLFLVAWGLSRLFRPEEPGEV